MIYDFVCPHCKRTYQREIKMSDYDTEKDKQFCDDDKTKLERVIEWNGPATNLGGYSDVAGRAGWQS